MSFESWSNDLARHISERGKPRAPACDCCNDTGYAWGMECYGGPPVVVGVRCPDCSTGDRVDASFIDALIEDGVPIPPRP